MKRLVKDKNANAQPQTAIDQTTALKVRTYFLAKLLLDNQTLDRNLQKGMMKECSLLLGTLQYRSTLAQLFQLVVAKEKLYRNLQLESCN